MSEKLGELLVKAKLITEDDLKRAVETQNQVGGKLGAILVKLRVIPEEKMIECIGQSMNLPVLKLKDLTVNPKVSSLLDLELLEKHQFLPIRKEGDSLTLAVADPLDYDAIDEVRFLTGLRTQLAVASRSNIQKAIDFYFHGLPCPELSEADAAVSSVRAAVTGNRTGVRVPPAEVLQALVDLLIDKKIITREELTARLGKGK